MILAVNMWDQIAEFFTTLALGFKFVFTLFVKVLDFIYQLISSFNYSPLSIYLMYPKIILFQM